MSDKVKIEDKDDKPCEDGWAVPAGQEKSAKKVEPKKAEPAKAEK